MCIYIFFFGQCYENSRLPVNWQGTGNIWNTFGSSGNDAFDIWLWGPPSCQSRLPLARPCVGTKNCFWHPNTFWFQKVSAQKLTLTKGKTRNPCSEKTLWWIENRALVTFGQLLSSHVIPIFVLREWLTPRPNTRSCSIWRALDGPCHHRGHRLVDCISYLGVMM